MKKIKLLFFCAFLFNFLKPMAQPVITEAEFPAIGDSVFYQNVSNTVFNPGPSGANVTWDFSGLTPTGSPFAQVMVDPSTVLGGDSFPTANQAISQLLGSAFYERTASQFIVRGYITTDIIYYSDGELFMNFPFTYDNSFTDPFFASVSSGYYRVGTMSVHADGYGTLKLPNGTYSNVLRVKFVEQYADSIPGYGAVHYNSTLYNWYKPGVVGNLLGYTIETDQAGDTTIVYAYNASLTATGIDEVAQQGGQLNIFPIPASRYFYINTNEKWDNYTIYDLTGRTIKKGVLDADKKNIVSLDDFSQGVYIVQCNKLSGGMATQKIVVSQ